MRPVEEERHKIRGVAYKLSTKVFSNNSKIDILITGSHQGRNVCSYEARINKRNMPAQIPHPFSELTELEKYLKESSNYHFDSESRELSILFKDGL